MDELIFPGHARTAMQADSLTEDDICAVVSDYDEMIERQDGHTEFERMLDDGRQVMVVVDHDGRIVVTVWWNRRRSRRR